MTNDHMRLSRDIWGRLSISLFAATKLEEWCSQYKERAFFYAALECPFSYLLKLIRRVFHLGYQLWLLPCWTRRTLCQLIEGKSSEKLQFFPRQNAFIHSQRSFEVLVKYFTPTVLLHFHSIIKLVQILKLFTRLSGLVFCLFIFAKGIWFYLQTCSKTF